MNMRISLIEELTQPNQLATPIDDDDYSLDDDTGEYGQDPAEILARREEIAGVNIRGLVAVTDH